MSNDFDIKSYAFTAASVTLVADSVKMLRKSGTAVEVQLMEEALGNLVEARDSIRHRLD
jgi:hypothetical protein